MCHLELILWVAILLNMYICDVAICCRFKNSDALVKEVTRLVRLSPDCVSGIPAAVEYLATAHSVEADAPEVTTALDTHLRF